MVQKLTVLKFCFYSLWRRPRYMHLAIIVGALIFIIYLQLKHEPAQNTQTFNPDASRSNQFGFDVHKGARKLSRLFEVFEARKDIKRKAARENSIQTDDLVKISKDIESYEKFFEKINSNEKRDTEPEKSKNLDQRNEEPLAPPVVFVKSNEFNKNAEDLTMPAALQEQRILDNMKKLADKYDLRQEIESNHIEEIKLKLDWAGWQMDQQKLKESKKCFELKTKHKNLVLYDDIMKTPPQPDQNIFFHDTSCTENGQIKFSMRQACSIESAAKWHPNRDIYVLFAAPVGFRLNQTDPRYVSELKSYQNIRFRNVDWYNYANDTVAEQWVQEDIVQSRHYMQYLWDVLRVFTLYKFGGIDLDLDVIVRENMDEMPRNFAGARTNYSVGAAVLGLESQGDGRRIAETLIRKHTDNYNDKILNYMEQGALTKVLVDLCGTENTNNMTIKACSGFEVLPIKTFYPINHLETANFFNSTSSMVQTTMEKVKESPAVHLSDGNSFKYKNKYSDETALKILATQNCPKVLSAVPIGEDF